MKCSIKESPTDYVTALMFVLLLFLPLLLSVIGTRPASTKMEKRMPAPFPELSLKPEKIKQFPEGFEAYFNDRFGLRRHLTAAYMHLKYYMGDTASSLVTRGKKDWLFLGSIRHKGAAFNDPVGDYLGKNLYSQESLEATCERLSAIRAWLRERQIEYILLVAPNKHTIYSDLLPNYIGPPSRITATDQLIASLRSRTNIRLIYPRSALERLSKDHQVFRKIDTHWNHRGAEIVQYILTNEVEALFPGAVEPTRYVLEEIEKTGGDLADLLGVPGLKDMVPEPVFRMCSQLEKEPPDAVPTEPHTLICKDRLLSALVFRDSFFNALQPYMARQFQRSTYIWGPLRYKTLAEYVKKEKPDIVIEEWVERSLPYIPVSHPEFRAALDRVRFENSREHLFHNQWDQLTFNNPITVKNDKGAQLELMSSGRDPMILFPSLRLNPGGIYIVHIEMESSVDSKAQLFFSRQGILKPLFTEKNSKRFKVKSGHNEVFISFGAPDLGHYLRLDPLVAEGQVVIKEIQVVRYRYKKG